MFILTALLAVKLKLKNGYTIMETGISIKTIGFDYLELRFRPFRTKINYPLDGVQGYFLTTEIYQVIAIIQRISSVSMIHFACPIVCL